MKNDLVVRFAALTLAAVLLAPVGLAVLNTAAAIVV